MAELSEVPGAVVDDAGLRHVGSPLAEQRRLVSGAALAPLGFVLCTSGDGYAGFGPKGEPALWLHLHKGDAMTGAHVAFRAAAASGAPSLPPTHRSCWRPCAPPSPRRRSSP